MARVVVSGGVMRAVDVPKRAREVFLLGRVRVASSWGVTDSTIVFVPRARADCLLQHGGRHGRDAIRFHAECEEELRRRDFVQDDGGPRGRVEHRFQGSGRFHRRRRPRRRFFRHHHLRRRDPRPAGAVLDRSLSPMGWVRPRKRVWDIARRSFTHSSRCSYDIFY